MRRRLSLAALGGLLGCSDAEDAPRDPVVLVSAAAWTLAPEAEDAFADQRPAEVECDAGRGFAIEERQDGSSVFEVNTGWCNYITVAQPLLEGVQAGEEIEVRVWHFDLSSAEAAEGYVGVGLSGEVVWSETVPIPSASGPINAVFEAPVDYEAGEPIQFHIHNHGINAWEIVSITRL